MRYLISSKFSRCVVSILLMMSVVLCGCTMEEGVYYRDAVVVATNSDRVVICVDEDSTQWCFVSASYLNYGDEIRLEISDNGTRNRSDDILLDFVAYK